MDFRQMISETYRYCIDKDPIIEQAQELHHQFEMAFAKRIQVIAEEVDEEIEEPMIEDAEMDETEILQNMLSVGRAMEVELDNMVKKELEDIAPEIMEEVIGIMQKNKESLDVESDGTVAVSYDDLSAKTIYEIRKLIRAKKLEKERSITLEEESMNVDVMS